MLAFDNSRAATSAALAGKTALDDELKKLKTNFANLRREVDVRVENHRTRYEHFQRELDLAKSLRDDLVKSVVPTPRILFPSQGANEDPYAMVAELVPEGPAGCRRMAESAARTAANHALAVVKSHYPRVNMTAVDEGYAADCSKEDIDRLVVEVAPAAAALVNDLDLH
uniref:Uncharacterized protein n=1 Tax=Oryza barthii TaxID=65489 RepID=A0A0D3F2X4_9ORYZ